MRIEESGCVAFVVGLVRISFHFYSMGKCLFWHLAGSMPLLREYATLRYICILFSMTLIMSNIMLAMRCSTDYFYLFGFFWSPPIQTHSHSVV